MRLKVTLNVRLAKEAMGGAVLPGGAAASGRYVRHPFATSVCYCCWFHSGGVCWSAACGALACCRPLLLLLPMLPSRVLT